MSFSLKYGSVGVISAIFILVILSQTPLVPVELSLTGLSIIELRDDPNEPKGTSLTVSGFRIHHYMIGIGIIVLTLISIYLLNKSQKKKFVPVSTFFLGFGGFLIIDQLPNIITGIWDRPVF